MNSFFGLKRAQGPSVIEIRPTDSNKPSTADRVSRPHEKAGNKVRRFASGKFCNLYLNEWESKLDYVAYAATSEINSINHYHYH